MAKAGPRTPGWATGPDGRLRGLPQLRYPPGTG